MSVFSLAGGSVLGVFENVSIKSTPTTVETKSVTRIYDRPQVTKKEWSVETSLMQNNCGATKRIDHLSVTVLTVDAADFLATFMSGEISMDANVVEKKEAGVLWKTKQITGKKLTFTGEFAVATGAASTLLTYLKSGTVSDHDVTVIMTIDAVPYEFPAVLTDIELKGEREGLYVVSATFEGQSPDSGAFPTTPTGTTSLIEKAFNSRAQVAVALTTQSSNGNSFSGNALITSFKMRVDDANKIDYQFSLMGTGALS